MKLLLSILFCFSIVFTFSQEEKIYHPQNGDSIYLKTIKEKKKTVHRVYFHCADSLGILAHNGGGCGGSVLYSLETKTDSGWVKLTDFYGYTVCALYVLEFSPHLSGHFNLYPNLLAGQYRISFLKLTDKKAIKMRGDSSFQYPGEADEKYLLVWRSDSFYIAP